MHHSGPPSLTPAVVFGLLRKHKYLWIAPAVAGLVITAAFTLVTPRTWSASQGLIVRSEAAGYADQRLGKFTDLSEMKTVQETVLELARSATVVTAALQQVGPERAWGSRDWPSRSDVQELRERLTITPPGGAEFGNTEVFYLRVEQKSPQRARQLVSALADQLERRLQVLRGETAGSMVRELEQSFATAQQGLDEEVARLASFESELGSQLSELRFLTNTGGHQSVIEQQAAAIEHELRALDTNRQKNQQLLQTLSTAQSHPDKLLATPSSLLAANPNLLRLKEGLVNAQIRRASLLGSRSPEHPMVKAAEATEANLRDEINRLAPQAVRGVEMELALDNARDASLRERLRLLRDQQASIAGRRAEYAKLLANVENQTRVADTARAQLADAQAHLAGVQGASVLARLDRAESDLYPVGPGRAVLSLAGGLFGLLAGLGAVFTFHGPQAPQPNATGVAPAAPRRAGQPTQSPAPAVDATTPLVAPGCPYTHTSTASLFTAS